MIVIRGALKSAGKWFRPIGRYSGCQNGGMGKAFPKISKAKDGLREAHMDVLVAVFGKAFPISPSTEATRLGLP